MLNVITQEGILLSLVSGSKSVHHRKSAILAMMSKPNSKTTTTQPVGIVAKMTIHHPHHYPPPPTTTHTNSMPAISQLYWPTFDKTLMVDFLAAMSSSRSDVVTKCVRSSVMKEFFSSIKSYNGVSRKPKGCFNEV